MENVTEISSDMLVGQILRIHPESADILMSMGMHCIGCPSSQAESLADACMVHGINADEVTAALNAAFSA